MTVGIGILGVGETTIVVVVTETGTVIGGLAMGQRVPLVVTKPKMVATLGETVVTLVITATITATVMDRVILVHRQTRGVHSETKISRALHSLGPCRGLLKMA